MGNNTDLKKKKTKELVLDWLLAANQPISGAALAKKLGLSRNSVWKAIEQLREDGHEIDGKTNQGYRLVSCENQLMQPLIQRCLEPITDYRLEIYKEVGSTNDVAKEAAKRGEAENLVVLAESQTAGKGRRGRSFFSKAGDGIYMSLLFKPPIPFQEAQQLTTLTAVAVARAIEKNCPVEVGIKWVNDLFINGKKICGILTEVEMDVETRELKYAVVGLGVNVRKQNFPKELEGIVTTLEDESGMQVERNKLAADILREIHTLYQELLEPNSVTESYQAEYARRSIVLGKEITVYSGAESYPARAVAIGEHAGLIIETAEGRETIYSGEVSVRLM